MMAKKTLEFTRWELAILFTGTKLHYGNTRSMLQRKIKKGTVRSSEAAMELSSLRELMDRLNVAFLELKAQDEAKAGR